MPRLIANRLRAGHHADLPAGHIVEAEHSAVGTGQDTGALSKNQSRKFDNLHARKRHRRRPHSTSAVPFTITSKRVRVSTGIHSILSA
jgi:hypothetical protein